MKTKNMVSVKVIIADDHKFFRDGLQTALRRISGIHKITHAGTGQDVLDILKQEPHDLVFMDVKMPEMNGIETTKEITKSFPRVKVIALSMYDDNKNVVEMFNSGAAGYILKNTDKAEIEKAIAEVLEGRNYFSVAVSGELFQSLIHKQKTKGTAAELKFLTEREEEIIRLICKEYTTPEMAKKLFITEKTIETHRRDLLEKTKAKNVAGLVMWAAKNGYCNDL